MSDKNMAQFRTQIEEDIDLIASQLGLGNDKLSKPEYAFNYWVLGRLFSIDEEMIPNYITEYNDKGIDCFVDFSDSQELIIIQNKYYSADTCVRAEDVSDFLTRPLAMLTQNCYAKSAELQRIFNTAKDLSEYKIRFCFFSLSASKSNDIEPLIRAFNMNQLGVKCLISAEYYGISDIYDLYYGKNYKEDRKFIYRLGTINRGTFASLRDEYGIEASYQAYYIIAPITQIFKMLRQAAAKEYPLFEKNIREYLGENTVNNGIVETLRSKTERKNFMFYNNGITIICDAIGKDEIDTSTQLRMIPLVNPQIVNGCQTANSIKKVLGILTEAEMEDGYKNVYVMLKALVIENRAEQQNKDFYGNVVKYTNKQNAISDKAFVSNTEHFYRLQDEFKERGFLLLVKPSDSNAAKGLALTEINDLIKEARKTVECLGCNIAGRDDLCIPLEKLLQVFLAFVKDGYFAFTKKHRLLLQGSDIFDTYSSQIHKYLTATNMIRLFCLYKRSESEQKQKDNADRTPIPYYVIGFLGALIGERTEQTAPQVRTSLETIFEDKDVFNEAYRYLVALTKNYRRSYEKEGKGDYTLMIKRPIEKDILRRAIESASDFGQWETVNRWVKRDE